MTAASENISGIAAMRMGASFRYPAEYDTAVQSVDGLPNFHHATHDSRFVALPRLYKGITAFAGVKGPDGLRVPAIMIVSSAHKAGTETTPWQDYFDIDNGHIRYFGDNRSASSDPASVRGNKALLLAFSKHRALDVTGRCSAPPLLFFRREVTGVVQFQGYGVAERAERVIQYDRRSGGYFSNYMFDFVVLNLVEENDLLDWRWIHSRRDPSLSLGETSALAPASWRIWLREGQASLSRCRRRVSTLLVASREEQVPEQDSEAGGILRTVYQFFDNRVGREKYRFEALASHVARAVLSLGENDYREGWLTPPSADGGSDFIGRLDVGAGFSKLKLVVYGQAKCEKLDAPTSGRHVARTVARLKRGWIGVYVTTSYFSVAVQQEILEDQWPVLLINGRRLAVEVQKLADASGLAIVDYLARVAASYEGLVSQRRPEEILLVP